MTHDQGLVAWLELHFHFATKKALLELAKNEQIPVEQIDKLLSGEIAQVKRTAGRGVIKLDKDGNPYVTETFTAKIKKEQIPGDDLPPPGSRGGAPRKT